MTRSTNLWKPTHSTSKPINLLNDILTDTDDGSDIVAEVDPETLAHIVLSQLEPGKVSDLDKVYNEILEKVTGTGFYTHLAGAFTLSLKLGYIPYVWKITVLCMPFTKPDKLASQTTIYKPISLLSSIMKLFERVIKNHFENTLKIRVSLTSIRQAL